MEGYDLIVLGGGPAGYTAALEAAKSGARVAIVEKADVGGTCLNRGCIPTKILLETVSVLERIESAENFAISVSGKAKINMAQLIRRKSDIVANLKNGLINMILSSSIEIINAKGKIIDDMKVLVESEKPYTIKGKKLIIATGTREAELNIKGKEFMINSTKALALDSIPENLCIVGGGVVGVELATFYKGIGCNVTILEAMPRILESIDHEIADMIKDNIIAKGIKISNSSKLKGINKVGQTLQIVYESNGQDEKIESDMIINATGRQPNTDDIGLDNIGIKLDDRGYIKVDRYLRTSAENIYAAGDVIGGKLLAHVAFHEGMIAARNAVNGSMEEEGGRVVPYCIYTHPEMASAGVTEEQARKNKKKFKKGYFPMSANGRALSEGGESGIVKVIVDEIGQIIGVHMFGEHSTEIIETAVIAIEGEYTCDEFGDMIVAHPTISETLKDAVNNCRNR